MTETVPGSMYIHARLSLLAIVISLACGMAAAQQSILQVHNHRLVVAGPGELEVAVSGDGQHVLVAVNVPNPLDDTPHRSSDLLRSDHAGNDAFTPVTSLPRGGIADSRDPTVTWTGAGKFYFATMGSTKSAIISVSTDNGHTFTAPPGTGSTPEKTPALCVGNACGSDQPHIAGDRRPGQDQLYIVWRNTGPNGFFSMIGCSMDGGVTWKHGTLEPYLPASSRTGDYPRVTVGPDGNVYVVMATARTDGDILLQRYSPCSAGMHPFWTDSHSLGAPSKIAHFKGVPCSFGDTVSGLDRCNNGNLLSSHTVAVDNAHPKHVLVSFANETSSGNDDVVVISTNDITTIGRNTLFPNSFTVNHDSGGQRYFPWLCSTTERVYAGWYDRRSQTAAHNDNTEYWVGDDQGNEIEASNAIDRQCDSGWPTGGAEQEAAACSQQPQFAGFCLPCAPGTAGCNAHPARTTPRCQLPSGACPVHTSCMPAPGNRGSGKYGDYTAIACAGGNAYVAWASATAPGDLAATVGLSVYFARIDLVNVAPPPPPSAACQACQADRNSCMEDAHPANVHECAAIFNHCRSINHCH